MKNKKQLYLLVGVVILLLVFFLFPDPASADRKRVVTKAAVSLEDLVSVTIVKPEATFTLYKQAGRWTLGENFFDVDTTQVTKLLELAAQEWKLEIVSDEGVYHKYGLGEETRTEIELKAGDEQTLRHVYIGESGNRYNARYVTFVDDERIFLTFDKLGFTFDVQAVDLRNKDILSLNIKSIKQVRVRRQKKKTQDFVTTTLNKETETTDDVEGAEPQSETTDGEHKWVDEAGKTYKQNEVNDVFNTLLALRARSFADDKSLEDYADQAKIIYEIITSESGQSEASVYLFEKDEDEGYLTGISTQDFLFYIPLDDGERLDVKLKDLIESE